MEPCVGSRKGLINTLIKYLADTADMKYKNYTLC